MKITFFGGTIQGMWLMVGVNRVLGDKVLVAESNKTKT